MRGSDGVGRLRGCCPRFARSSSCFRGFADRMFFGRFRSRFTRCSSRLRGLGRHVGPPGARWFSGAVANRYYVLPFGRYPGRPYLTRTVECDSPTSPQRVGRVGWLYGRLGYRLPGEPDIRTSVHPANQNSDHRCPEWSTGKCISAGHKPLGTADFDANRITGNNCRRAATYVHRGSVGVRTHLLQPRSPCGKSVGRALCVALPDSLTTQGKGKLSIRDGAVTRKVSQFPRAEGATRWTSHPQPATGRHLCQRGLDHRFVRMHHLTQAAGRRPSRSAAPGGPGSRCSCCAWER